MLESKTVTESVAREKNIYSWHARSIAACFLPARGRADFGFAVVGPTKKLCVMTTFLSKPPTCLDLPSRAANSPGDQDFPSWPTLHAGSAAAGMLFSQLPSSFLHHSYFREDAQ